MRESQNVEDRRGMGPKAAVGGGLGVIIIIVLALLFNQNPQQALQQIQQQQQQASQTGQVARSPGEEKAAQFVRRVLGDTEDVWTKLFAQNSLKYEPPVLVMFAGKVQSACGFASYQMGPFYCPADRKIYIDLEFFDQLANKFGAPGDFAQAYVVAHEVAHHIQNLLGTTGKVDAARGRVSQAEYNDLSTRLELQADFLAGVWAHHSQRERQTLEQGDVEEGLRAANAIGDDTLQKQAQGYAVPDSFTHGSSAQRVRWFTKGLQSGDLTQGDTFSANPL
jgi:uncharacterized protein